MEDPNSAITAVAEHLQGFLPKDAATGHPRTSEDERRLARAHAAAVSWLAAACAAAQVGREQMMRGRYNASIVPFFHGR